MSLSDGLFLLAFSHRFQFLNIYIFGKKKRKKEKENQNKIYLLKPFLSVCFIRHKLRAIYLVSFMKVSLQGRSIERRVADLRGEVGRLLSKMAFSRSLMRVLANSKGNLLTLS